MNNMSLHQKILWGVLALLALINMGQTILHLSAIYPRKKPIAFHFAGQKFEGIQKFLKNEKYAGYYTDQAEQDPRRMMELLQAQYAVIPLILDPESLEHRFIIVNCTNVASAIEKFKALGAQPVTRSHMGLFIVERPGFKP